MEHDDYIVTLIDEEGDAFDFMFIDSFMLEDKEYAVLLPVQDDEDEAEGDDGTDYLGASDDHENDSGTNGETPEEQAVLFRIFREVDGETSFQLIDDEDEWQRVSTVAIERLCNDEE